MRRWLNPLLVFLTGICIGWGFGTDYKAIQPSGAKPIATLPVRGFDRAAWNASYATADEKVAVRKSMEQSVLARFKPGAKIVDVMTDLGAPDYTEAIRDYPPPAAGLEDFGKAGKFTLDYHIDNVDDGFLFLHDWSWAAVVEFVFDGDGKLVSARESLS